MSAITVRFENAVDPMLLRPFKAGVRHFQVAFCTDAMGLVKELSHARYEI